MRIPIEFQIPSEKGTREVQEQAEIILAHLVGREPVDPRFILVHATTLLQYAAGLEKNETGRDPAELFQAPC